MAVGDIDLDAFLALETQVWEALCRGDAAADGRLLSEDFLGVYPSGFANRADHVGQLADGPTVVDFELFDARLMVLSDDDVMLSYRAECHEITAGQRSERETMYISSLWCRRSGAWVNVFSQDTPAAAPS
jgi:hypothetical protein